MLITLAFRIPREHLDGVVGTVTAYPLTQDFAAAWDTLPRLYGKQPPYAVLATGLIAATGNPVRLFGESNLAADEVAAGSRSLLLTSDNALDRRLRTAVQAWERHLRDGEGSLVLAEQLPEPEPARAFSDYIALSTRRAPTAPGWVYRTAAWKIMRRVASTPLLIDDERTLALRIDTDGSLLAWDDLLARTTGDKTAFAMAKLTVKLVTKVGVEDPVLCFDAHLSRLSPRWYGRQTKHAWIAREEGATPILRLPVRHRKDKETDEWVSHLDPAIAAILEACQLKALELPAELPEKPDIVRPQLTYSRYQSIGSGPGPRFMYYLYKHILRTIPELKPLTYELDKRIKLPQPVRKFMIDGIPSDGVGPSGYKHVTLVCLYSTPDARRRMLAGLKALTGRPIRPTPGGPGIKINDRLDVVAVWSDELVSHNTVNRLEYLDQLRKMSSDPHHLVAVWAETSFHPLADRPELDAKPHMRTLLAHLGIPSQFMATDPPVLPKNAEPRNEEVYEHVSRAALRDLLRAAGILDRRLLDALTTSRLKYPLNRKTLLVGIHLRRQQTGNGDPVLVLIMVAVYIDPASLESCRILVWSDLSRGWVRSAEGITSFYAGPIGSSRLGRSGEKAIRTRTLIENSLCDLATGDFADTPMVVFIGTRAARSIWPGLKDPQVGDGPLPGDLLRERGGDVAVVRLNTETEEIGRPVARVERSNKPGDANQPAAPGRKIYQLKDSVVPSWLFPGTSVRYRAKNGRRGAQRTRWNLSKDVDANTAMNDPWHSYTAKEIVVVEAGSWPPEALAVLTARMCEQAISWDDRTMSPVPLHLAKSVDEDHPNYRRSGFDEIPAVVEGDEAADA
ncbi:RNaseH domain-containing protein [Acrocarpospora catenulata]|uniref:RNaseH domain-containing protein n=1 Tax=Acrocarpospora catenulata TaxID=2836182 RepID=UPI001BD9D5D7|nr:RNaseH domain-containing protein [Acrocarpospora catenulata]